MTDAEVPVVYYSVRATFKNPDGGHTTTGRQVFNTLEVLKLRINDLLATPNLWSFSVDCDDVDLDFL